MKLLTTAILAIAFASQAFAQSEPSSDTQALPIRAVIVAEKNGSTKVLSRNGRFEFRGVVHDKWSNRDIVTRQDAERAFHYIELTGLQSDLVKHLEPFQLGRGERQIMIFVDPLCSACDEVMKQIPLNSPDYTFNIIPVALLGKESQEIMKNLECAVDQSAAFDQLLTKNFAPLKSMQPCGMERVTKRMFFADILGVLAIPFIIRDDGLVARGVPAAGLEAWLEG